MLIFFGLGNPSEKYLKTKHNIGKILLYNIVKNNNLRFTKQGNFTFCKTIFENQQVYFLYSNLYMNENGLSLASFYSYFKLDFFQKPSKLILLHDDSDQFCQRIKLTVGGGFAGHNGVKSIYKVADNLGIKQENIWRLKIGIRPLNNHQKSEFFVLSNLNKEELEFGQNLALKCNKLLPAFVNQDLPKLQNNLNFNLKT
jgi:peptidyl-tRNA hydrolase, PTH1 family